MTNGTITIGGVTYDVALTPQLTPPDPTPTPPPDPTPPPAPTVIRVGTATYAIAAVDPTPATNPPGATYAGARGPDQLVIYTTGPATVTNPYGAEFAVSLDGTVVAVNDRQTASLTAAAKGTPIPAGGYVVSTHGAARAWAMPRLTLGARIDLLVGEPTPTPSTGARTLAVYVMDKVGSPSQIPAQCDQARVAFLQGTQLVDWGGETPAQTAAGFTSWRTPGRETLVSIGGQGGAVTMGGIVGAFHTIETVAPSFPVNGPDWDIEKGGLNVPTAVAVSKELARGRGDEWVTSFVPPGGPPVPVYLDAAVQCQKAGLRVQFGQQLYDTAINLDAVLKQTEIAVRALGEESVLLGCMVGTDPAKYSTVAQWETYLRAVVQKWPRIGGAYLWESSRPGTAEWAARLGAVLAGA